MSICLHGSTFLGSVVEVVNKIVSAFTGREFYELDWEEPLVRVEGTWRKRTGLGD